MISEITIPVLRLDGPNGSVGDGTVATVVWGIRIGSLVTNLSTSVAQSSAASMFVPVFKLNNEYLFFQVAWEITGAGAAADRDVLVRYGPGGTTDGSGLVTAPFLTDAVAAAPVAGLMPFYYRALVMDEA